MAPTSPVQIGAGQTLTDDGTVNFESGVAVSFPTVGNFTGGETTQIVVNGVLSASDTNFINPGNAPYSLNQIAVNSGGELIANSSTFGLNQLVLANGSVMNPEGPDQRRFQPADLRPVPGCARCWATTRASRP